MITADQIEAITDDASELSDVLTETVRLWVAARVSKYPADALMAVSGGALIYSLAECCGRFVAADVLEPWAEVMTRDIVKISREIQREKHRPN